MQLGSERASELAAVIAAKRAADIEGAAELFAVRARRKRLCQLKQHRQDRANKAGPGLALGVRRETARGQRGPRKPGWATGPRAAGDSPRRSGALLGVVADALCQGRSSRAAPTRDEAAGRRGAAAAFLSGLC